MSAQRGIYWGRTGRCQPLDEFPGRSTGPFRNDLAGPRIRSLEGIDKIVEEVGAGRKNRVAGKRHGKIRGECECIQGVPGCCNGGPVLGVRPDQLLVPLVVKGKHIRIVGQQRILPQFNHILGGVCRFLPLPGIEIVLGQYGQCGPPGGPSEFGGLIRQVRSCCFEFLFDEGPGFLIGSPGLQRVVRR